MGKIKMAASVVLRSFCQNRSKINQSFFKIAVPSVVNKLVPTCQIPMVVKTGAGFVGKVTADDLWRSATSVSNAGRKRGRAKGLRRRVDLNKGQRLGVGRAGTVFPGLTGPAITKN